MTRWNGIILLDSFSFDLPEFQVKYSLIIMEIIQIGQSIMVPLTISVNSSDVRFLSSVGGLEALACLKPQEGFLVGKIGIYDCSLSRFLSYKKGM